MKSKYTIFQIAIEILGLIMILGMIIFVCLQWNQLPDKIPGHFNVMGEVDRWGSENELITLPIISTFLYTVLTVLSFLPQTWSVPVKTTNLDREVVYRHTRSLLILIKVEILLIFLYITYCMTKAQSLSSGVISIIILVIFITIINYAINIRKIGKE
ncbi:DUF1648 domain-containing protein [Clostridium sp.]|uniref:DUF1648 domain-containing protein n=1 Tax=Clostridium sp. TaxID=1506 RepID=UPI002FC9070A